MFEQMRSLVDRRRGLGGQKASSNKQPSNNDEEKQNKQEKQQNSSDDDVIILTDSNFDSNLKGSKDLWMVKFFGMRLRII